MAIGYERARNLMRQLNWRMRVKTICDSVEKIVLFHPCQGKEYTVRMDSEPFPVWWTVKMEKKQNETEDILRYLT